MCITVCRTYAVHMLCIIKRTRGCSAHINGDFSSVGAISQVVTAFGARFVAQVTSGRSLDRYLKAVPREREKKRGTKTAVPGESLDREGKGKYQTEDLEE